MEMQYRLNQEKLLSEHKLNKEILINALARLNKKINMVYGSIKKKKAELSTYNLSSSYGQYIQRQIIECEKTQDQLKNKRQPILHVVMSAYKLSLNDVKELTKQANKENYPTYKTIDNIVDMINSVDYSLI